MRIVYVITEKKALATLADAKVLKCTEFFNTYTWSYQRPARFDENVLDIILLISAIATRVHICTKGASILSRLQEWKLLP